MSERAILLGVRGFKSLPLHFSDSRIIIGSSSKRNTYIYTHQGINLLGVLNVRSQVQIEVVHYPTLKTVMAVEEVVKKADTAVSRNQIIARLPTKPMRSTLNVALDYLEKRGMVLETKKGFVWTFNPSKKLAKAEEQGLEV